MSRWRGLTALIATAAAVGTTALTAVGWLPLLAWPVAVLLTVVAITLQILHVRRRGDVARAERYAERAERDAAEARRRPQPPIDDSWGGWYR